MLEHLLFIPKQLLNTSMLGFRQIRSLATSLKTTWILLAVDIHDPNISPEILDRLSYKDDYYVRCKVAKHPNTSPETLNRLSYVPFDGSGFVIWYVAENPNAPPEALDRIYCGGYMWVLNDVLRNPNTPQYIKDHYKFRQFLKWHTDGPVT